MMLKETDIALATEFYRVLEVGETIQKDDEYHRQGESEWYPTASVGCKVDNKHQPYLTYRRKINEVDILKTEVARLNGIIGQWESAAVVTFAICEEIAAQRDAALREVEGLKKDLLKTEQELRGLRQRTGPESKPAPEYRDLAQGEMIRKEDEVLTCGIWVPTLNPGVLVDKDSLPYRRKIRIQSPGYRWLDSTEIIPPGAEFPFMQRIPIWEFSMRIGSHVGDDNNYYRVKL